LLLGYLHKKTVKIPLLIYLVFCIVAMLPIAVAMLFFYVTRPVGVNGRGVSKFTFGRSKKFIAWEETKRIEKYRRMIYTRKNTITII
jgi:hypothetical protein